VPENGRGASQADGCSLAAFGLFVIRCRKPIQSSRALMSKDRATRGVDKAGFGTGKPTRSLLEVCSKLRPRELYHMLSMVFVSAWLLDSRRIHPAYRMTWWKKLKLAFRMCKNALRIRTGTSYKAHMAMAAKLLEIPPEVEGVVVECGCWLGGSTANLSLICDIVGRKLIVYDSFEGLPEGEPGDRHAKESAAGLFRGDLELVKENVRRFGVIERCEFRRGWFRDTLPRHTEPIVLCFLDVDFQASLHDCIVNLWPHLTEKGYVFIDEFMFLDYCALFFSERFWKEHFDAPPPGLMGAGTGVGVGQYYLGPFDWSQDPASVAYTRKDFYALWDYVRKDSTPRA
jgi:O-methyltransferase